LYLQTQLAYSQARLTCTKTTLIHEQFKHDNCLSVFLASTSFINFVRYGDHTMANEKRQTTNKDQQNIHIKQKI
jgi:hypothetical protein